MFCNTFFSTLSYIHSGSLAELISINYKSVVTRSHAASFTVSKCVCAFTMLFLYCEIVVLGNCPV